MGNLSWTCHICKENRPDAAISVHKKPLILHGQRFGDQNIRYCNDRPACLEGAKEFSFVPEER